MREDLERQVVAARREQSAAPLSGDERDEATLDEALKDPSFVAEFVAGGVLREEPPLCVHRHRHRALGRDWHNDASRLICGVCHPPASGPC